MSCSVDSVLKVSETGLVRKHQQKEHPKIHWHITAFLRMRKFAAQYLSEEIRNARGGLFTFCVKVSRLEGASLSRFVIMLGERARRQVMTLVR